jgi:hypothetical protein
MPNPGIMQKRSLLITADDANFYACETWQLKIRFNYPQTALEFYGSSFLSAECAIGRRKIAIAVPLRINELNGTERSLL